MISQSVRTATAAVGGTLDEALAAIGEALEFEPYYGRNLDALADSLTDLEEPTTLQLDGWQYLAWADPAGWGRLRTVLDQRSTNRLAGVQGVTTLPAFRVVAGRDEAPVTAV